MDDTSNLLGNTQTIPAPVPLPPVSRMPLSRNPRFVGREADLQALANILQASEAAIGQIVVITGPRGIGKTQLANEFVYRYGQYFAGGVFWLNFADPATIPVEIASCGRQDYLNLDSDFDTLDLKAQVHLVLSAWQSALPRLLVFDACEDKALLTQWQPMGGCRVLVTSRHSRWNLTSGMQVLPLGVLSRMESVALLCQHRPDLTDDDADLDMIAEELEDFPLAMHLAGSFLACYRHAVTPEAYLGQLRDKVLLSHLSSPRRGITLSLINPELYVGQTFALSYGRLNPTNPTDDLALKLLASAACFAPDQAIPRHLLLATLSYFPEAEPEADSLNISSQEPIASNQIALQAEDALAQLVKLGLLNVEAEGLLVLHSLLATFILGVTTKVEAQLAVEEVLLTEATRLNNAGHSISIQTWQPHLRGAVDVAQVRGDEWGAALCNVLGYHLRMLGDYAGARPYLERTLMIVEKSLGTEHPYTIISLNNLAGLLKDEGDYAGARSCLERALTLQEKVLGVEHPDTATNLNNLGFLLNAMGNRSEARPYYERALGISEKILGAEHPYTITSLNNLGMLLYDEGDYVGARPYLEQVLVIREKMLGAEHPDTATSLNNLGLLFHYEGDYAGARPCLERALAVREKVLGVEHLDTASSLNNMGLLLYDEGDYIEARSYLERALAIREKILGAGHPETQIVRGNLVILSSSNF